MLPALGAAFTPEAFAGELETFLDEEFDCGAAEGGFVPSTFSAPTSEAPAPARAFDCDAFRAARRSAPLPPAGPAGGTSEALAIAIDEYNEGIHERCAPEAVRRCWIEAGLADGGLFRADAEEFVAIPLGAVFTSVLIRASDPPVPVASSARNLELFERFREAGLLVPPEEAPRPGDFVFFRRGGTGGHSGIVHSVSDDGFTYVAGNVADQVGLRRLDLRPARSGGLERLGFARVP